MTDLLVNQGALTAHKGKLVRLTWRDSEQPCSAWVWEDDVEQRDAFMCHTVGWVVYCTTNTVAIAANRTLPDTKEPRSQYMGITRLPLDCITYVELLPE